MNKEIVHINGYSLGVHGCSIAEGDWKSLRLRHGAHPLRPGGRAARRVDKAERGGQNEKASFQVWLRSDRGLLTALVPEWRNWQTR